MIRFFFLTILFYAVFFTFVSYSVSKAYFASMAIASGNSFSAASEFPTPTGSENTITGTPTETPRLTPSEIPTSTPTETPTPTPSAGKIVINEVSMAGNIDVDWVELFNSGGSTVTLTGWKIQDNGVTADTLPGSVTIPAGSFAVIVASGSSVVIPAGAQKIELTSVQIGTNGLAAAGDRVILFDQTNAVIDNVSYGSDATIFNITAPTGTQTLRRIPNGIDTNTAGDWSAGIGSIGVSN